jgi:hypothetical protein
VLARGFTVPATGAVALAVVVVEAAVTVIVPCITAYPWIVQ